jgi:calcium/calmodulin-dependent protein kinase I
VKEFKLGAELGAGAYSKVYRAYLKSDPLRQEVALKVTEKSQLSPEDVVGIHQEAEIMRSFSHPNIVAFYSFFEDRKFFYSALEIIEGGQLYDRIATKHNYSESEARELVTILLTAIQYCHERGVAHRDLKPENLLMSSKLDDAQVKIADFGFAKRCPKGEMNGLFTQLGTPAYIAPEIISHRKYGIRLL